MKRYTVVSVAFVSYCLVNLKEIVLQKYLTSVFLVLFFHRSLVVVHFWAPWAPQCVQMNNVMAELAKEHSLVTFVKVS